MNRPTYVYMIIVEISSLCGLVDDSKQARYLHILTHKSAVY